MSIQEKELKGILKSLKAINAALGTVANSDLAEDIQEVITAEAVLNSVLDTAVAGEATSNALLDSLVTDEVAQKADLDACVLMVGTPADASSISDQTVLLFAQLE